MVKNALIKISTERLLITDSSNRKEKRAAQNLAKKYGPILDSFNDVVFIIDKAGYFVSVNKASEQIAGIPSEAFIGRHFLEIIDSKYHGFARNSFQKALSGEKIVSAIEMERQTKSGEKIILEINWEVLYEDNVRVGILGVSRDVTDRKHAKEALKRACDELEMRVKESTSELQKINDRIKKQINKRIQVEEKLKQSEQKYRGLFENFGDAIILFDIDTGKIIDANRQAESLTGRSRQELNGMHHSRLHSAQEVNYYEEKFREHINNELIFDLEAEIVKKDGTTVPVFICSNQVCRPAKFGLYLWFILR